MGDTVPLFAEEELDGGASSPGGFVDLGGPPPPLPEPPLALRLQGPRAKRRFAADAWRAMEKARALEDEARKQWDRAMQIPLDDDDEF